MSVDVSHSLARTETECPECGRTFARIARHWGATCPYPEIDDELRAHLDGLMLGRASADGDQGTRLRIWTTNRELALWTFEKLGWLGHTVRRRPANEDSLGDRDRFVVSTLSHPECERYRRWGPEAIRRLEWSSVLGRMWFAHAGSVLYRRGSLSSIQFRTGDDATRKAIHSLLVDSGFEAAIGAEVVVLSQTVAAEFLSAFGDPVPGVEHKWATDQRRYRQLLGEQ